MPPEPSPWDRKDFFKQRKRGRLEPVGRWRDSSSPSYYHYGYSRDFTRLEYGDFGRPSGHGKHGNWHMYAGDFCQGHAPTGFSDKMLEDERSPSFNSSGDGKYGRSGNRENRGYYRQRDRKGHFWEESNASPKTLRRPPNVNNEQRTVNNVQMHASHAHSDFLRKNAQHNLKDQHDNNKIYVNGLGALRRCEKENSVGPMDWKPFKRNHSRSLLLRGSGFSCSNSSRSFCGVDSSEGKADLNQKIQNPLQSPSGDVAPCVTSSTSCNETTASASKKPRLGWGEGLAKYEQKKVESPDDSVNSDGDIVFVNNAKPHHSLNSSYAEKSPGFFGLPDFAFPEKPSSVACGFSPVLVQKTPGQAADFNDEIGKSCVCCSCLRCQNHPGQLPFDLENLDINSIANLGTSLIGLLHLDDPTLVDSGFVQSTALNKLVVWKSDVLKALEKTESEMDLLENQIRSFKSDSESRHLCQTEFCSFSLGENGKSYYKLETCHNMNTWPAPLQIDHCEDAIRENMLDYHAIFDESKGDVQVKEIDSFATAASEFIEPTPLPKAVFSSDVIGHHGCSEDLVAAMSTTLERRCVASYSNDESIGVSEYRDGDVIMDINSNRKVIDCGTAGGNCEMVLCDAILKKNKELAYKASKIFSKLLSKVHSDVEITGVGNASCLHSDLAIREKFEKHKRYMKFKERVLAFKHEAYHHLWKEDIRLLSERNSSAKAQKVMTSQHQQHHFSINYHLVSPVGNLSLASTMEIINSRSKLSSESRVKLYREALKMPALFLDEKDKLVSRFVSSNGLVEDPCSFEKERAIINPWTYQEKEVFMDKLSTCGKDFRKIASFLDHKTTADCVEFYYKNHKSDGFKKPKKHDLSRHGKSSTNSYLATLGKEWNREVNAASLEMLGAASAIAESAFRKQSSCRIILGSSSSKTSQIDDGIKERPCSYDYVSNDTETEAADVLAGIGTYLSSEAVDSFVTSSVDPDNNDHKWKCQKVVSVTERLSISDDSQNSDDDTCSDESFREMSSDWTDGEKSMFIQAVSSYGKDFAMISQCVRTRSRDQCKVFFSKARKCLGLDFIHRRAIEAGTPMSDDANDGAYDPEDARLLESSVVCLDKCFVAILKLMRSLLSWNNNSFSTVSPFCYGVWLKVLISFAFGSEKHQMIKVNFQSL